MAKTSRDRQRGAGRQADTRGSYDDTNRGVLFPNDKGDNDARPDWTGNLAIDPKDYDIGDDGLIRIRLAAWNKTSRNGDDFLSIAASRPQKN